MPKTTTLPAAPAPTFTATSEIALIWLNRTIKNFIGSQCQMIADDLADFAVEQRCRIGMDTQNIGCGTGSNFQYEKAEQFFLYFFI